MRLIDIAAIAMDEYIAENGSAQGGSDNLPPDLMAHDKKYHHGHYNGGKCKYREDRQAALEGKQESEWGDIIDKLTPEDVEGEEIDNADRLEGAAAGGTVSAKASDPEAEIKKLNSVLGLMKSGIGKSIIGHFIKKNEAESIGPKLEKLRAFAKSLGLDPSKIAYGAEAQAARGGTGSGGSGSIEDSDQLKAKRERLTKDMDMLREKMQNASPRLAALLQEQLDGMEKSIKGIDKKLSGAGGTDEKAEAKERKRKEKEAQKRAKDAFHNEIKNSSAPMMLSKDPVDGKTVAMDSADFKKAFSELPIDQRIYAISDIHSTEWKKMGMSKSGTVFIAGDISDEFYSSPKHGESVANKIEQAQKWIDSTFAPFCAKHKEQTFVMCPGNHDTILGLKEAKDLKWPENVKLLNDSETSANGMKIYGTGICARKSGTPESYFTERPFELTEEEYKKRADAIPEGLDVLLIHHPPKVEGYNGDKTMVYGKSENNGVAYLTEIIKRKKPKLVICGHLHDGDHRPYKIGDSVVINAAKTSGWSRSSKGYSHHDIGIVKGKNGVGFFVDGEDSHISK